MARPEGSTPARLSIQDDGKISVEEKYRKDDSCSEIYHADVPFDSGEFSDGELQILQSVAGLFSGKRTGEVKDLSLEEPAWKENEGERQLISYQRYAFGVGAGLLIDTVAVFREDYTSLCFSMRLFLSCCCSLISLAVVFSKINLIKMKHFTIITVLVLCLLMSCKKKHPVINEDLECPVTAVIGSKNQIVGKWKLVKAQNSFTPEPTIPKDYSCNNVIYDFKSDGSLIITSDVPEESVGNSPGTRSYKFSHNKLEINNQEQYFALAETTLEINNSPLDGEVLKLIRID